LAKASNSELSIIFWFSLLINHQQVKHKIYTCQVCFGSWHKKYYLYSWNSLCYVDNGG